MKIQLNHLRKLRAWIIGGIWVLLLVWVVILGVWVLCWVWTWVSNIADQREKQMEEEAEVENVRNFSPPSTGYYAC